MPPYWYALNILAAALQLAIGIACVRRRRFWVFPIWTTVCLLSPIPALLYVLWVIPGPLPAWLNWYRAASLVLVTLEASRLLLYRIFEDATRKWRILAANCMGAIALLLAVLGRLSPMGLARTWCFGMLITSIGLWAWRAYPTISFGMAHAAVIVAWLGTRAFASALKPATRAEWYVIDSTAVALQAACYVLWLALGIASPSTMRREKLP